MEVYKAKCGNMKLISGATLICQRFYDMKHELGLRLGIGLQFDVKHMVFSIVDLLGIEQPSHNTIMFSVFFGFLVFALILRRTPYPHKYVIFFCLNEFHLL